MIEGAGWIFGGTALAGIGMACWSQLQSVGRQLLSRMIVSFDVRFNPLIQAVDCYARDCLKASPFRGLAYEGAVLNVRPRRREQLVIAEEPSHAGKLYWKGWRPIWMQLHQDDKRGYRLSLWYFRGTFDAENLMFEVAEHYNRSVLGLGRPQKTGRYSVQYVFGTAGKKFASRSQHDGGEGTTASGRVHPNKPSGNIEDERDRRTKRILHWSHDDIGPNLIANGDSLGRLALSDEAQHAVEQFKNWLDLEDWYKSRGIPWRTNWLLYGPPGTGKSSLIQAIAEDYDLPIWVFDLATLYNDELHREWGRMLAEVPCIALIEDFDKVFEGSANISKGDLTLDCLLNCIDGVSRANGLFLAMTTNRIDALDPALKRPGRADSILEMAGPNHAGLVKIASRILPDEPWRWDELASEHAGQSGAGFQRICEEAALESLHRSSRPLVVSQD